MAGVLRGAIVRRASGEKSSPVQAAVLTYKVLRS